MRALWSPSSLYLPKWCETSPSTGQQKELDTSQDTIPADIRGHNSPTGEQRAVLFQHEQLAHHRGGQIRTQRQQEWNQVRTSDSSNLKASHPYLLRSLSPRGPVCTACSGRPVQWREKRPLKVFPLGIKTAAKEWKKNLILFITALISSLINHCV